MLVTPAPDTMGLGAPLLGPWFGDATLQLAVPADNTLAIAIQPGADTQWLPPAAGIARVYLAPAVARGLSELRGPDGTSPFTHGSPLVSKVVVVVELLPQVAERLATLQAALPGVATADVGTGAGRTRIRSFALEYDFPGAAQLATDLNPSPVPSDAATVLPLLGLLPDGSGHGPRTGNRLVRPGTVPLVRDVLVRMRANVTYHLHTFDEAGRSVDPGAVAAWWARLALVDADGTTATANPNLWADNTAARTAPVAAGLVVHLVNPHEGPARAEVVARLGAENGLAQTTAIDSAPDLFLANPANGNATTITAPADPGPNGPGGNHAPNIRVALLPDGRYDGRVTLWSAIPNAGAANAFIRDYIRVGVVSVERHLIGSPRATDSLDTEPRRTAEWTAAPGARPPIARTTTPTLVAATDGVHGALFTALGNGGDTDLFAEQLDVDWCAWTAATLDAAAGVLPDDPPTLDVVPLAGSGRRHNGLLVDQDVLVTLTLDASLVGAWVRLWTRQVDLTTGQVRRLAGASAMVVAETDSGTDVGRARCVLRLPDGQLDPAVRPGVDVMVRTSAADRRFADVRFDRPDLLDGAELDVTAGDLIVCETGARLTGGTIPAGSLPPDAHLVVLADPPALLDRATRTAADWLPASYRAVVADTLRATLTTPPFAAQHTDDDASLAPATLRRRDRSLSLVDMGRPKRGQHRLESVVVSDGAGAPLGVVGGAPLRAGVHESFPHDAGHPGLPAAGETVGCGVTLNGDAAAALRGQAQIWRPTGLDDLWDTLATAPPAFTAVAAPSAHVALLRTVGAGTELDVLVNQVANLTDLLPLSDNIVALANAVNGLPGVTLPNPLDAASQAGLLRLERAALHAGFGAHEGASALVDAIGRAEDFIWIETPGLDTLQVDPDGGGPSVFTALAARLQANRNLGVVLCVPATPRASVPDMLEAIRTTLTARAVATLRADAGSPGVGDRIADRVVLFSPSAGPGRGLRIATTTVVIDDAWALTGTTHLTRRGLSWDSSLAVSVFDEALTAGRPTDIVGFRSALVAQRLGIPANQVPRTGRGLVRLVQALQSSGGQGRLARFPAPDPTIQATDVLQHVWNPDGSRDSGVAGLFDTVSEAALAGFAGDTSAWEGVLTPEDP